MKVITRTRFMELKAAAFEASQNVRGCRQRAKAEASMLIASLEAEAAVEEVEDPVGYNAVYTYTCNLGTKRWSDLYKEVGTTGKIVRETPKMLFGALDRCNKDKVICLIKEEEV